VQDLMPGLGGTMAQAPVSNVFQRGNVRFSPKTSHYKLEAGTATRLEIEPVTGS
jgi:hypothetical protein